MIKLPNKMDYKWRLDNCCQSTYSVKNVIQAVAKLAIEFGEAITDVVLALVKLVIGIVFVPIVAVFQLACALYRACYHVPGLYQFWLFVEKQRVKSSYTRLYDSILESLASGSSPNDLRRQLFSKPLYANQFSFYSGVQRESILALLSPTEAGYLAFTDVGLLDGGVLSLGINDIQQVYVLEYDPYCLGRCKVTTDGSKTWLVPQNYVYITCLGRDSEGCIHFSREQLRHINARVG